MADLPSSSIAIGIPVRDEEALLPRLLQALSRQREVDPETVTVAFLLDGCTDASEAVVRGWDAPFATLVSSIARAEPNAGRARRAAMTMAEASGAARLATTDADSAPAPDWLASIGRALADADVVAGRIVRSPERPDPAQDAVERYYDRLHAHRREIDPVAWDPAPGHHHTGGANLAFRAEAYRALGGFDPVPCGEDALIVDRAHRLGLRVRRDAAARVETSSRRCGRAPGGLASALAWHDRGGPARVAHPADVTWQYHGQAIARAAFARLDGSATELASRLGLPVDEILTVAGECPNAEAFAMRIAPAVPGGPRIVTLAEAQAALDALADARAEVAA
ncbi:MAG: glycosyltransferase [Janthinobacterium lividum]